MGIIKKGFVQAMNGKEVWINTTTDERITVYIKDENIRNDIYCKYVKVTIEVIPESEINP